jgi:hypothetical protein
MSLHIS